MSDSRVKQLDIHTLILSEPIRVKEIEDVFITLTKKVNEIVIQVNNITEGLVK